MSSIFGKANTASELANWEKKQKKARKTVSHRDGIHKCSCGAHWDADERHREGYFPFWACGRKHFDYVSAFDIFVMSRVCESHYDEETKSYTYSAEPLRDEDGFCPFTINEENVMGSLVRMSNEGILSFSKSIYYGVEMFTVWFSRSRPFNFPKTCPDARKFGIKSAPIDARFFEES